MEPDESAPIEIHGAINFCVYDFEQMVLGGKKKMTENERLFFKAGLFYQIQYSKIMYDSVTHNAQLSDDERKEKFLIAIEGMKEECFAFKDGELQKFHAFFCDNPNCKHREGDYGLA